MSYEMLRKHHDLQERVTILEMTVRMLDETIRLMQTTSQVPQRPTITLPKVERGAAR